VQLGELQKALTEFDERGVTVVVVSVDAPEVTLPWARKKSFTFAMVSDPELEVIRKWGLENTDVGNLSLHAAFILDEQGKVFYRKVARRRPYSPEFLDAIDYHYAR
jgi:peroxiredoxin